MKPARVRERGGIDSRLIKIFHPFIEKRKLNSQVDLFFFSRDENSIKKERKRRYKEDEKGSLSSLAVELPYLKKKKKLEKYSIR